MDKVVDFKETVVLCRWGVETNVWFKTELITKGKLANLPLVINSVDKSKNCKLIILFCVFVIQCIFVLKTKDILCPFQLTVYSFQLFLLVIYMALMVSLLILTGA